MPPIRHIVTGDCEILRRRHLLAVRKKFIDVSMRDFNVDIFDAATATVESIISAISSAPMFADFRFVEIQSAEKIEKAAWNKIIAVLSHAENATHAVFVFESFDKRLKDSKALLAIAELFEFKTPYDNQLPRLVLDEAKRLGLNFKSGAAEALVDAVGGDLGLLFGEIEKLALALAPRLDVTVQDIENQAAPGLVHNVFLLGKALGERRLGQAMQLYHRMVEQGESPVKIHALILGHFRKIRLVKAGDPSGISPYFLKEYEVQARLFGDAELAHIHAELLKTAQLLRSSSLSRELILEPVFYKIGVRMKKAAA